MSKNKQQSSAPAAPSFSPSTIMYGDQTVGKTYKDKNGQLITQYMPTAEEQQTKQAAQQQINQILPTLGQPDANVSKQYDDMANTYVDQATTAFNRAYDPALRQTREDYASRFGGLNNTPYLDQLQNMETQMRQPAMLDIARQGTLLKQDLYNQDQARKLNTLQGLGYTLNNSQQNFLNGLNAPMNASTMLNNFNQNNYMQQLQQYNFNRQLQNQGVKTIFGGIGGVL